MDFASDNWVGAAPEIMDAIVAANDGAHAAYGGDDLTAAVERAFCNVFERDVAVFLVGTGGAANGLALSTLSPPYRVIICHEASHVQMDECSGPEFFTGGAKLLPVPGVDGKIHPDELGIALASFPERPPHGAPFSVVTITQATECGTVYRRHELEQLCGAAHDAGLKVHMDGARFANALVTLGCTPAEMTWRAGVDVLSFGATKNGCLAAEAVIFFDPAQAADFAFRRKRAGQLFSKSRFMAAQFDAYFRDDLWLRLAGKANSSAQKLSAGLSSIPGVKIWRPTEANEVFASFPGDVAERLRAGGARFFPWVTPGDPADGTMNRLICSYATPTSQVEAFLAATRAAVA